MNIRRKITLTYLCLTILALGVGLFMWQVSRQIARSLTHNEQHFQKIILASTEAVNFSKRAEGHLMLFLTLGGSEDRKKFPDRCASLQQQIDVLHRTVANEDAKTILARLAAKASQIRPTGDAILAAYDRDFSSKGSFTPADHRKAIAEFCALTASVRALAEELTVFEIELDSRVQKNAAARAEALQRYALTGLLLGAALITVGGILVLRRIFRPIDRLTHALSEIHKHSADTTSPLPIEAPDEVGSLTASFNRMLEMRRHSEERFRQLFNLSNDAIMVCALNADRSAGRFIEVNDVGCTRLGYTRNELMQLTLADLCPPDKLPEVATSLAHIPEKTRLMVEMEQLTKSGQRIVVETSIHRISLHGKPCVLAVSRDITQRRQLENQLRQSQKMEAIGQLAGGVAHDFNNIIAGNLLYIDLLLHAANLPKDVHNTLTELKNNEQRAANLTRQLLMFGRRQFLQVTTFNLVDVLTRMVSMIERIIGEQVRLSFNSQQPQLWIHADAGMMEQVVVNLCINARDAMPKGGRLSLTASEIEIAPGGVAARPEAAPGRYACLKVEDTGCGMPPHILTRIFEPFFTTKEIGRGSGLGLSTAYGIIQQHGGWIDVESVVGQGSTFAIFVPTTTPAETIASRKDSTPSLFSGRETVLLVEDEQIVRRSLSLSLRSMGYQVVDASNPAEAMEKWRSENARIDLLITDMVMPGDTSGLDLAKNLLAEKSSLKVLITSGYSMDLQNSEALSRLHFSFLPKPFEMATLALTVKRCLTQSSGSVSPLPAKELKK
ncbi:MAG: response regulator [Nibricoccus sp.]